MFYDNLIYAFLLCILIWIGPFIRQFKNNDFRQKVSAAVGFLVLLFALRWHIVHHTAVIFINGLIVLYMNNRICHILSFIFCFTYMTVIRVGYVIGAPPPFSYGLATQMFLTLKMVGLAFEVHDTAIRRSDKNKKDSLEDAYLSVSPTMKDIFCYGFCHAGILVGPYFKYRTYWDSFHAPYSIHTNWKPHLLKRLKFVPLYVMLFLFLDFIYPASYASSDEIYTRSLLYRIWYATPTTFNYRLRLYIGFILAECQCISATIGVYPASSKPKSGHGPTMLGNLNRDKGFDDNSVQPVEFNYETIHNINVYESEFALTTKDLGWNWNMTVQYWLAAYVYKRLPLSLKSYRSPITMLMSAFWHGLHPAYYLWAATISLMFLTEEAMIRAFRNTSTPGRQKVFDWLCWLFRTQILYYNGMAFVILKSTSLFQYWSSIYFIGHVLLGLLYFISLGIANLSDGKKHN